MAELSPIRKRQFGQTGLHVSEFGLGCARIGGIFKQNPTDFVELLTAALEAGINFFDTADIYSQGESERLLARAFRKRRDDVIIASKAGFVLPSQRLVVARLKPFVRPLIRLLGLSRRQVPGVVRGSLSQDFTARHLRLSVERSLRRLQTDRLDLFQLHSPPTSVVEAGEWVEALETLKRSGKIRYYGISCDMPDAAVAALEFSSVSSIQVPLNLLDRRAEAVSARAGERGVAVIARECLANGLLIKEVSNTDIRSYCQSDDEAAAKAAQLVAYRRAAADAGATVTQMALDFVTHLAGVGVTLVGVSTIGQLRELLSSGISLAARRGSAPQSA